MILMRWSLFTHLNNLSSGQILTGSVLHVLPSITPPWDTVSSIFYCWQASIPHPETQSAPYFTVGKLPYPTLRHSQLYILRLASLPTLRHSQLYMFYCWQASIPHPETQSAPYFTVGKLPYPTLRHSQLYILRLASLHTQPWDIASSICFTVGKPPYPTLRHSQLYMFYGWQASIPHSETQSALYVLLLVSLYTTPWALYVLPLQTPLLQANSALHHVLSLSTPFPGVLLLASLQDVLLFARLNTPPLDSRLYILCYCFQASLPPGPNRF